MRSHLNGFEETFTWSVELTPKWFDFAGLFWPVANESSITCIPTKMVGQFSCESSSLVEPRHFEKKSGPLSGRRPTCTVRSCWNPSLPNWSGSQTGRFCRIVLSASIESYSSEALEGSFLLASMRPPSGSHGFAAEFTLSRKTQPPRRFPFFGFYTGLVLGMVATSGAFAPFSFGVA